MLEAGLVSCPRPHNYSTAGLLGMDSSGPSRKRVRLEGEGSAEEESMSKTRVVLALCGSMSPITNLHLRMFGKLE